MSENSPEPQSFNVVFKGELVKGATAEQVKNNIAKLFKADPAKLEHLFTGGAVTIKKGLDLAGADKYESVLRRAGAIVELVEVGTAAPDTQTGAAANSEKKTVPKTAASLSEVAEETIASAASPTPPPSPPQAPANLTVAEVGATLVEYVVPPPADFDTTHLNLAELGVDLVEAEKIAAPQYDLSGLVLDPVGVDLVEKKPVAKAEFDTSSFSLHEPANDSS